MSDVGDEYQLDPAGLAALGRALTGSASSAGLDGAITSIQELADRMVASAGNDRYTKGFRDEVNKLKGLLREAHAVANTAVRNMGTNIDAMVITGVDSDQANAAALAKARAPLEQV